MGRKFKFLFIIYRNLLKTKSATFNHLNIIIIFFIVYELDTRSRDLNYHFTCLSGGVKLGKNGDPDKYVKTFLVLDSVCVQNFHYLKVVWVNMLLIYELIWGHLCILIIKKDILILGESLKQRLDDTTLTAEAQNSINYSRSNRKICLNLPYNGRNSFLFVNSTKVYQFKAKDSEIKQYPLCLGNISGDFWANNMKKQD